MREPEAIDLFLHAARAGLFDMHWDILCPHSGLVLESFGKLRALKSHFVCGLCDIDGETELDDFIEVTFSVSPQVRRLSLHDPDSLSVEDLHWKLHFSGTGRLPGGETRFRRFPARPGSGHDLSAARRDHDGAGRARTRRPFGRQRADAGRIRAAGQRARRPPTPTRVAHRL